MKFSLEKGETSANYDNRFIVTSVGNIYDTVAKEWKCQWFNCNGYLRVGLAGKNLLAHRVVALAFLPNPENKPTINHKNGIKYDNRIENLEWATYQENNLHALKTGLRSGRNISHVKYEKPIVITHIRSGVQTSFKNRKEAASALGVVESMITMAANGSRPTCRGYIVRHEKALQ